MFHNVTHLVSEEERLRSAITPTIEARRPFGLESDPSRCSRERVAPVKQKRRRIPATRALGRPGLTHTLAIPHAEPTHRLSPACARGQRPCSLRPDPESTTPSQRSRGARAATTQDLLLLLSSCRLRLSPASTANSFLPAHSLKKRIKKASISSCLALGISRAYSYRLFKAKEGGYDRELLGEGMGDEDV